MKERVHPESLDSSVLNLSILVYYRNCIFLNMVSFRNKIYCV